MISTAFFIILAGVLTWAGMLIAIVLFTFLAGLGYAYLNPRFMNRDALDVSMHLLYSTQAVSQLTGFFAAIVNAIVAPIQSVGSRYFSSFSALRRLLGAIFLVFIVYLVARYHDKGVTLLDGGYKCAVYPYANEYALPFANSIRMTWDTTAAVTITARRLGSFWTSIPVKTLVTCDTKNTIKDSLYAAGEVIGAFFESNVEWQQDSLHQDFNFTRPLRAFGRLVQSFNEPLECICAALNPLWSVLTNLFSHPSFATGVNALLNSIINLVQTVIIAVENAVNQAEGTSKRSQTHNMRQRSMLAPDGRPDFTDAFSKLCNGTIGVAQWIDDVVQDSVDGVIVLFAGKNYTIPPFAGVVSYPVCGVTSFIAVVLNTLVRADLLGDVAVAEEYINLTPSEAWWLEWSGALGVLVDQLGDDASCAVENLSESLVYAAFGVIEMIKSLGIDLRVGESASVILADLWTAGNFDASFVSWNGFADCLGAFIGQAFQPLGCLVTSILRLASSLLEIMLNFVRTVSTAAVGSSGGLSIVNAINNATSSGEFSGPKNELLAIAGCLQDLGDYLFPGIGCIFSGTLDIIVQGISAFFSIISVFLNAYSAGTNYSAAIADAWDDGVFYGPFNASYALADCIGGTFGLLQPDLGCTLRYTMRVAVDLLFDTFLTVNVIAKSVANNTDPGAIFLAYYDAGQYGNVYTEVQGLSVCASRGATLLYPTVGCVVGSTINTLNEVSNALAFIIISIVRAAVFGDNYAVLLSQAWFVVPSPLASPFVALGELTGCIANLLNLVGPNTVCVARQLLAAPVVLVYDLADAAARVSKSTTDGRTPGYFFFDAWYADQYELLPDTMKMLGGCIEEGIGIIPDLPPAIGETVYNAIALTVDLVYSGFFEALVVVAQAAATDQSFPALFVMRWDQGRFMNVSVDLETFLFEAPQIIAPLQPQIANTISYFGVAASRIFSNLFEFPIIIMRVTSTGVSYATAYARADIRDPWTPLYNASDALGSLIGTAQPQLGAVITSIIRFGASSLRFVFHFADDAILASVAGTDPYQYISRDYNAGTLDYFYDDFFGVGAALADLFDLFLTGLGCITVNAFAIAEGILRGMLVFMLNFEAAISVGVQEGGAQFLTTFGQLYTLAAQGSGQSSLEKIGNFGPCFTQLDQLIDPLNHCAIESLFGVVGAVGGLCSRIGLILSTSLASGATAGGEELEFQWEQNGMNATFVNLDRAAVCIGSVAVTYFFPSLDCMVPALVSLPVGLLWDLSSFLIMLEKSIRLSINFDSVVDVGIQNGQLGHMNAATYNIAACIDLLSETGDDVYSALVGCLVSSLVRFSDQFIQLLVNIGVLVAAGSENGQGAGAILYTRWFSGSLDGVFLEWDNATSCLGGIVGKGNEPLGVFVTEILRLPFSLIDDIITFLLVADHARATNGNFGLQFQSLWDEGEGNKFINNWYAVGSSLNVTLAQAHPVIGCFAQAIFVPAGALLQWIVQLAIDFSKGNLPGTQFGIQFVQSYRLGRYNSVSDALAAFSDCVDELGSLADPFFGCFLSGLTSAGFGLLQDVASFVVVVATVSTSQGTITFKDEFAASWNAGSMAHLALGVYNAGTCLSGLVAEANLQDSTVPPGSPPAFFATEAPAKREVSLHPTNSRTRTIHSVHARPIRRGLGAQGTSILESMRSQRSTSSLVTSDVFYALGRLACVPAQTLRFLGATIIGLFQSLVDIFCTSSFDENLAAGKYVLVTETSYALFACVTDALSLLSPGTGCIVQRALMLVGEFVTDMVDFGAAFSRSVTLGTNFGDELAEAMAQGKLNGTYSDLEALATCTQSLGQVGNISVLCIASSAMRIVNRAVSALFITGVQVLQSDGLPWQYYTVAKNNWNAGLFNPIFDSVDQLADCLGDILNLAYNQLGCFVSSPIRFVNRIFRTAIQMFFDVAGPDGSSSFDQAWYAGNYSSLFTSEQVLFSCVSAPIGDLDIGLSCALYSGLDYAVSLVTDMIDAILAFKTAVDTPLNFGVALQQALDAGRLNATYANTANLASCLTEIGGVYLGGVGCFAGSIFTLINGVGKAGLQFFIDAAVSTGDSATFPATFSAHWDQGKYNALYDGIDGVADCLQHVFGEIDSRVGCIPANLLRFVSEVLRAAVQIILDIFVNNNFEADWYAGKYVPLFTSEQALFGCLGQIASLADAPSSCLPNTVLGYLVTLFTDTVDMGLVFRDSINGGVNFGLGINNALALGRINATFNNTAQLAICATAVFGQNSPQFGALVGSLIHFLGSVSYALFCSAADFIQASYTGDFVGVFGADWANGKLQMPFDALDSVSDALGALLDSISVNFACFFQQALLLGSRIARAMFQLLYDFASAKDFPQSFDGTGGLGTGSYDPLFDAFDGLFGCASSILGLADSNLGCIAQHTFDYITALTKDTIDFLLTIYRAAQSDANFGLQLRAAIAAGRLQFTYNNTNQLATCLQNLTTLFSANIGCAMASTLRVGGAFLFSVVNLIADVSVGSSPEVTGQNVPEAFATSWKNGTYAPFFTQLDATGDCFANFLTPIAPQLGCVASSIVKLLSGLLQLIVQMLLDITVTNSFENSWEDGVYDAFFAREQAVFACIGNIIGVVNGPLGCIASALLNYLDTVFRDAVDMILAFRDSVSTGTNFGIEINAALNAGRMNATFNNTEVLASCSDQFIGSVYAPLGCIVASVVRVVNAVLRAILILFVQTAEGASSPGLAAAMVSNWDNGSFQPVFDSLDQVASCLGDLASGISPRLGCIPSSILMVGTGLIKAAAQWVVDTFARESFESQWRCGKYAQYTMRIDQLFSCVSGIVGLIDSPLGCTLYAIFNYIPSIASDLVDAYLAFQDVFTGEQTLGTTFRTSLNAGYLQATYTNTAQLAVCLGDLGNQTNPAIGCVFQNLPIFLNQVAIALLHLVLDIAQGASAGNFGALYKESWNTGVYAPAFSSAEALGACIGQFFALLSPALECPATTLVTLVVEVARSIVQWSVDTLDGADVFPQNWLAGTYAGVFDAVQAFFDCLGSLVGFINVDLGCLLAKILGYIPAVFEDTVDYIIAVQQAAQSDTNIGTQVRSYVANGRLAATRNQTRDVGACAQGFLNNIDVGMGSMAGALFNVTSDLGVAGITLSSVLFEGFGASTYDGFITDLRVSWLSGDYSFFYADLSALGDATGSFLNDIGGSQLQCFGPSFVGILSGAINGISQFSVDVFLGGDFQTSWNAGAYSPLFTALDTFALCLANLAGFFSPGVACLLHEIFVSILALAKDAVGLILTIQTAVQNGGDVGLALETALSNGAVTNVAVLLGSIGTCLGELTGTFSSDVSCILSTAFLTAQDLLIALLRTAAVFLEAPFETYGLYSSFGQQWSNGNYQPVLNDLNALGKCVGVMLSRVDTDLGCLVGNIVPVFTGLFSDIVNSLLGITGAFLEEGNIFIFLEIQWENGKLQGFMDGLSGLLGCAETFIGEAWPGAGTLVRYSIMFGIDLIRNIIYASILVGRCNASAASFGPAVSEAWADGTFAAPFNDLTMAAAGVSTMFAPISTFIGCIMSSITIGAIDALAYDASALLVQIFAASGTPTTFVTTLINSVTTSMLNTAGKDLRAVFILLHTTVPACLRNSDGLLPGQVGPILADVLSLIVSSIQGIFLVLVTAASSGFNPSTGFCVYWQAGSFAVPLQDAYTLATDISILAAQASDGSSIGVSFLVGPVLSAPTAFVQDAGDFFCTFATATSPDEFSTNIYNKYTSGGLQALLAQVKLAASNSASLFPSTFELGNCVVGSGFWFISGALSDLEQIGILFLSGNAPYLSLSGDIAGSVPSSDDYITLFVARLQDAWKSGGMRQTLNALQNAGGCIAMLGNAVDPYLGALLDSTSVLIEATIVCIIDLVNEFATAGTGREPFVTAILNWWQVNMAMEGFTAALDTFLDQFAAFVGELTAADLGCVARAPIDVVREVFDAVIQVLIELLEVTDLNRTQSVVPSAIDTKRSHMQNPVPLVHTVPSNLNFRRLGQKDHAARSDTFQEYFDQDWVNGKFTGAFDTLESASVCLGTLGARINPSLQSIVPAIVGMLAEVLRSGVQFCVIAIENGSSAQSFSTALTSAINDPTSGFVTPIFTYASQFGTGLGTFVSEVYPTLGTLVTAIVQVIVSFVQGIVRFMIVEGATIIAGQDPLAALFSDWTDTTTAFNGGLYSPVFTAYFAFASAAGNLLNVIHPTIDCFVTQVLSVPMHLVMLAVNLIVYVGRTDFFSLLNSGLFDVHVFNPLLSVASCVGSFFDLINTPLGCITQQLLSVGVQLVRFGTAFLVSLPYSVGLQEGLNNVIDETSLFSAITALGICIGNFVQQFGGTSPCSADPPFFCYLGYCVAEVFALISAILQKLMVQIPNAMFQGNLSSLVDLTQIIYDAERLIQSLGVTIGVLIPSPNPDSCSNGSWGFQVGNLIFSVIDLVFVPIKIMNMFFNAVLNGNTTAGGFIGQLMTILVSSVVNILTALAATLDCLSGAGSFFTTLAHILDTLVTTITNTILNIFLDIIRLAVDLFTGNLSDFGNAILSLLSDFGNFIAQIASTIVEAIIPGSVLENIVNFFDNGACEGAETVINGLIDGVNAIVGVLGCICSPAPLTTSRTTNGCNPSGIVCAADAGVFGCYDCVSPSECCRDVTTIGSCGTCGGTLTSVSYVSICPDKKRSTFPRSSTASDAPEWMQKVEELRKIRKAASSSDSEKVKWQSAMRSDLNAMQRNMKADPFAPNTGGFSRSQMYTRSDLYNNDTTDTSNATYVNTSVGADVTYGYAYAFTIATDAFYDAEVLIETASSYIGDTSILDSMTPLTEDDIARVIASIMVWNGTSVCDVLVRSFSNTSWSNISVVDRARFAECVQKRSFAMKLGMSIGWINIPQDILYNWVRPWSVSKDIFVGVSTYATCYLNNLTCATDVKNLTAILNENDINPSTVLYFLGLGEKTINSSIGQELLSSLSAALGGQSALGALATDLMALYTQTSTVISNTTSNISMSDAFANDMSAMAQLYNVTVNSSTSSNDTLSTRALDGMRQHRAQRRSLVGEENLEHTEDAEDETPLGILAQESIQKTKTYARHVQARSGSLTNDLFHPRQGAFVRLLRTVFDNGKNDTNPWNRTEFPAWVPHYADGRDTLFEEGMFSPLAWAQTTAQAVANHTATGWKSLWERTSSGMMNRTKTIQTMAIETHAEVVKKLHASHTNHIQWETVFPSATPPSGNATEELFPGAEEAMRRSVNILRNVRTSTALSVQDSIAGAYENLAAVTRTMEKKLSQIGERLEKLEHVAQPRSDAGHWAKMHAEKRAPSTWKPHPVPSRPATEISWTNSTMCTVEEKAAGWGIATSTIQTVHGPISLPAGVMTGASSLREVLLARDYASSWDFTVTCTSNRTVVPPERIASTDVVDPRDTALAYAAYENAKHALGSMVSTVPAVTSISFHMPTFAPSKMEDHPNAERNYNRVKAIIHLLNNQETTKFSRSTPNSCTEGVVCTNCLFADEVIGLAIDCYQRSATYYANLFPQMVQEYSAYTQSIENRSLDGAALHPILPSFQFAKIVDIFRPGTYGYNSSEQGDGTSSSGNDEEEITATDPRLQQSTVFYIVRATNAAIPGSMAFIDKIGSTLTSAYTFGTSLSGTEREVGSVVEGVAESIFTCNTTNLYTCESRRMSLLDGSLATGFIYVAIFVFMKLMKMPTMLFAPVLISVPWTLFYVTYNSAPICVVPPACVFDDAVDILRDTFLAPCLSWEGLMVPYEFLNTSSPDGVYTTDYPSDPVCSACDSRTHVVQCSSDLGFSDYEETILFAIRWAAPSFYRYIPSLPFPLTTLVTSARFRSYYDTFLLTPGSFPSTDPEVGAYLNSTLSEDGSFIPQVYKTCFFVTIGNVATLVVALPLITGVVSGIVWIIIALVYLIGTIVPIFLLLHRCAITSQLLMNGLAPSSSSSQTVSLDRQDDSTDHDSFQVSAGHRRSPRGSDISMAYMYRVATASLPAFLTPKRTSVRMQRSRTEPDEESQPFLSNENLLNERGAQTEHRGATVTRRNALNHSYSDAHATPSTPPMGYTRLQQRTDAPLPRYPPTKIRKSRERAPSDTTPATIHASSHAHSRIHEHSVDPPLRKNSHPHSLRRDLSTDSIRSASGHDSRSGFFPPANQLPDTLPIEDLNI